MTKTVSAWIREKITTEVLIAFLLGIVLGLVVLGWWLWPVSWVNSSPADLMAGHKETYMQLIADSYALTGNMDLARTRLATLSASAETLADQTAALEALAKARVAAGDASAAMRLQALSAALGSLPAVTGTPTPSPKPTAALGNQLLRVFGIVFFVALLAAGLLLLVQQLRKTEKPPRRPTTSADEEMLGMPNELQMGTAAAPAAQAQLLRYDTTYNLGDESYDVNRSIEAPSGEFLGECGVSAAEVWGVGQPGSVPAFEVWLFDKDDVRTETKVLVSDSVLGDAALRDKLSQKGELVKAQPGQVITLETANLRLEVTIMDLAYGSGADAGSFTTLGTRLDVFRK